MAMAASIRATRREREREGGRYVKSGSCELRDEGDELK